MSPKGFSVTILFLLGIMHLPLLPRVEAQEACNDVGDIQLVDGVDSNVLAGRIEICLNGTVWGTVSNYRWVADNVRVLCRQLGVAEDDLDEIVAANEILVSFGKGNSSQPVSIESINCTGSEDRLIDCQYAYNSNLSASHGTDVGVICERAQVCTDEEVRLVGGETDTEGRVELCVGGQWGAVCGGISWETEDVAVVCNELGYFTLDPQVLTPVPQVGNPNTPIVRKEVRCSQLDFRLVECQSGGNVGFCDHSEDAGANCTREIECTDNDVRLTNGGDDSEGIVEFCRDGYWGQVCQTGWDDQDAKVVCRQLGFDVENETAEVSDPSDFGLGDNPGRVWLTEVMCSGDEASLSQCSSQDLFPVFLCLFPNAGVNCSITPQDVTTAMPTDAPPQAETGGDGLMTEASTQGSEEGSTGLNALQIVLIIMGIIGGVLFCACVFFCLTLKSKLQ